jgi:hypothetical protein
LKEVTMRVRVLSALALAGVVGVAFIGRAFELGAGQPALEVDRMAVPFMIGP